MSLEPQISLEEADCYKKAEITYWVSRNEFRLVNELNKIAGSWNNIRIEKNVEILDGTQISKWLSVSEDGQVILDESGVKEFNGLSGENITILLAKRENFKTSYGVEITVKEGDLWLGWLNRYAEVAELKELILAGEKVKEKTSLSSDSPTVHGEDDIGDTYVEELI